MYIKRANNLSEIEINQVQKLLQACRDHDGTFEIPYLHESLNFDGKMPNFFLAYKGEDLIGFMSIGEDDGEVEISIRTHPNHRRQRVARALSKEWDEVKDEFPVIREVFVSEEIFLENNPDFLSNFGLKPLSEVDIIMDKERHSIDIEFTEISDISIGRINEEDYQAVAKIVSESFDMDYDLTLKNIKNIPSIDKTIPYKISKKETLVGVCLVDITGLFNHIYSLTVAQSHRRQGLASKLISFILKDLRNINDKDFRLEVNEDNPSAINLYKKLGFKERSKLIYLMRDK